MTKKKLERVISFKMPDNEDQWDKTDDDSCYHWFGRRYLGNGKLLCSYCLEEAVDFKGFLEEHICLACQQSLIELNHG